jgi:hypothetical protein
MEGRENADCVASLHAFTPPARERAGGGGVDPGHAFVRPSAADKQLKLDIIMQHFVHRSLWGAQTEDTHRPHQVLRYRADEGSKLRGEVVYTEQDESFSLSLEKTRSQRYITLYGASDATTYLMLLDADDPGGGGGGRLWVSPESFLVSPESLHPARQCSIVPRIPSADFPIVPVSAVPLVEEAFGCAASCGILPCASCQTRRFCVCVPEVAIGHSCPV